jgi:phosphate transport system protein
VVNRPDSDLEVSMATRKHYIDRLDNLKKTVVKEGTLVVKSLENALQAFLNKDTEKANEIITNDVRINDLAADIDDQCALIIAEEQPVARDLRLIINAVHLSTIIERIGDNSVHIAKTTILMSDKDMTRVIKSIPEMASISIGMVRDAIGAYVDLDPDRAREVATRDERVDELYAHAFRELERLMHEDPENISLATSLLFLIRRFERIADQSTHICEGVVFIVTAVHEELNL